MKQTIFLLFTLFSFSTFAVSDYQFQSVVRTYPVGFFAAGTAGESYKLWGQDGEKVKYGFVRASGTLQTSGVVNSVMGQVDFYPISFLGFYAGKDYTHRNFDVFTFDCTKLTCRGRMDRDYVGTRLALAYKDIFLMTEYRVIRASVQDKDKAFAEERSTLVGGPGQDTLHRTDFVLGYKLNPTYSVGYLMHRNVMQKYENSSHMNQGFVRYQGENWNLLMGTGTFHSRNDQTFYSSLIMFQWVGSKGLLLF
ncbi:MAG: hypothetical protein ACOYL6_11100 [Bacteriovoracaceae bacterium]